MCVFHRGSDITGLTIPEWCVYHNSPVKGDWQKVDKGKGTNIPCLNFNKL
jgi:hypothetical protein